MYCWSIKCHFLRRKASEKIIILKLTVHISRTIKPEILIYFWFLRFYTWNLYPFGSHFNWPLKTFLMSYDSNFPHIFSNAREVFTFSNLQRLCTLLKTCGRINYWKFVFNEELKECWKHNRVWFHSTRAQFQKSSLFAGQFRKRSKKKSN